LKTSQKNNKKKGFCQKKSKDVVPYLIAIQAVVSVLRCGGKGSWLIRVMPVSSFIVSRDDRIYEAWPDVALSASGRLVCVFAECTHHKDRSMTRIVQTTSDDRGRSWTPKRPITEATAGLPYFNCPRIVRLRDGRLVMLVDQLHQPEHLAELEDTRTLLYFSEDDGETWSSPFPTPVQGIVPDKLLELPNGRWIIAAHFKDRVFGYSVQRCWFSDSQGKDWQGPFEVGRQEGLNLCEASILPVGDRLVAFMRENSGDGQDCQKAISEDGGETWSPVVRFPIPGCHRPVAGWLQSGRILITHRFRQGGNGWGWSTQNTFASLTDEASALAAGRGEAHARIFPLDYDRSPESDCGYTGWVQFDDGEIYIVNYLVDDAPKGQIRGYSLFESDLLLFS